MFLHHKVHCIWLGLYAHMRLRMLLQVAVKRAAPEANCCACFGLCSQTKRHTFKEIIICCAISSGTFLKRSRSHIREDKSLSHTHTHTDYCLELLLYPSSHLLKHPSLSHDNTEKQFISGCTWILADRSAMLKIFEEPL